MGARITNNLLKSDHALLLAEKSEASCARLAERDLHVIPSAKAVAEAEIIVFAVPDALMRVVTAELIPFAPSGATVIMLDPAAAVANEVALRDDLQYVVCHPCHPPLFGEQHSEEARNDHFGGIAATQDIVIALMQGTEEAFAEAHELCQLMFAPVARVHRITVDQMAILEPAMAEVVVAAAAVLMREALEEAVKAGAPREAATAFILGHAQIPLAIAFGAIDSPFSDAAKVAINYGQKMIFRPDWRQVFEPHHLRTVIHQMLHPEDEQ
jgi:hypothetical protein